MSKKPFYITTAIAYASKKPHIGNTYEVVFTDAVARFKRMQGYDVYFLTGTDEHGLKIEELAKAEGISPKEHVDKVVAEIKEICKIMNISYDGFIRTTDEQHEKVVQKIFKKLYDNGDIYKSSYEGLYCTPCESFWTESQLVDGKCPDCGRDVETANEEAYFLKLSKYQKWLEEYIEEHPDFIVPESRKKEMLNNFIKPGLQDLCVSRTTFTWSIPVTFDPKHVIYVWLDALTNYITALGYMSDDDTLFKKYWPADLQIVGKDIIRFHGIYWPIFLMALGLPTPKKLYAHGFLMMKDGKMSKSKGNVVYPEMLVERYGLDATRYFLLKEFPYGQDAIFTPEDFVNKYNFDLCNDLGNLLNRTIGMVNKYFGGNVPNYTGRINDVDADLEEIVASKISEYENNMEDLHFSNAIESIWGIISRANKYIDETAPWTLAKQEETEKLESVMSHLVETLRIVAILIKPAMTETSNKILSQLGINEEASKEYDTIKEFGKTTSDLKVIEKGEPIFLRLDANEEIEYIKNKMKE